MGPVRLISILLAGLLLLSPPSSFAQSVDGSDGGSSADAAVVLIPLGGAYLPGVEGPGDVTAGVDSVLGGSETTVVVGGTIQMASPDGPVNVRLSGMKSTSAVVATGGIETGGTDRKEFLALTGDLVLRPIPRFLLQPYILGGAGAQRITPAAGDGGTGASGSASWEFVGKVGAGLDLRIGTRGVLVSAEVVDYLSNIGGDTEMGHDAMALVGLGIPLF